MLLLMVPLSSKALARAAALGKETPGFAGFLTKPCRNRRSPTRQYSVGFSRRLVTAWRWFDARVLAPSEVEILKPIALFASPPIIGCSEARRYQGILKRTIISFCYLITHCSDVLTPIRAYRPDTGYFCQDFFDSNHIAEL